MVSFELLAGLLIGYTLLYLLVTYFLRSRFGNGDGSRASSTPNSRVSGTVSAENDPGDAPASSALACGVCGVENEPGYTYCRNCVSELGGTYDRPSGSP